MSRPVIAGDVKNVHHLANRAARAMREAGVSKFVIVDMRLRVAGDNRWTLEEALEIAAEYVEILPPQADQQEARP